MSKCVCARVCVRGGDSLDFVLRVGFPAAALHLRWVQQTVLPDGVGPIAGQRLDHLHQKLFGTNTFRTSR